LRLSTGLCLSIMCSLMPRHFNDYALLSRSGRRRWNVTLDHATAVAANKRELILGTSAPDYPPFDMTSAVRTMKVSRQTMRASWAATGLPVRVQRLCIQGCCH
jgi:two-component system sensor histidine kinase EvgS